MSLTWLSPRTFDLTNFILIPLHPYDLFGNFYVIVGFGKLEEEFWAFDFGVSVSYYFSFSFKHEFYMISQMSFVT